MTIQFNSQKSADVFTYLGMKLGPDWYFLPFITLSLPLPSHLCRELTFLSLKYISIKYYFSMFILFYFLKISLKIFLLLQNVVWIGFTYFT